VAGRVDTGFIEARLEALTAPGEPSEGAIEAAAAALDLGESDGSPWSSAEGLAGFRLNAASASVRITCNGEVYSAPVDADFEADVLIADDEVVIFERGEAFVFTRPAAKDADEASASGDGAIRAPMPGKIVSVSAGAGDKVTRGQPLVTLEAMKMEHTLAAPFDGSVAEVSVKAGDQVSEGVVLARLERAELQA
jgi:acetyl/propionyl-CoA carboxylase alpha subunit